MKLHHFLHRTWVIIPLSNGVTVCGARGPCAGCAGYFQHMVLYTIVKDEGHFLAHLSTMCSKWAFRVVRCPSSVVRRASSTISLNIFSSQTAGPIWTKLGRNVPWEVLFKICSQNLIPSKTLVAMATKLNFLSNSLKIFSSGTAGPILK